MKMMPTYPTIPVVSSSTPFHAPRLLSLFYRFLLVHECLTGRDPAQDLTRPLAPAQDLTVLRGAGRECGRRVEAGRLRPAARQARHPTRWRLARSAGEGHQSPGRAPGRC